MVKMVSLRISRLLGAAAVTALLAASAALAQLSSEGGPIRVNADSSSVLERDRRVVVIGNVDIVQGDARLRADQVTLFYGGTGNSGGGIGGGFGDIERLRAEGNVFYVTPDLKARGDVGTYTASTETILLTASPGNEVTLIRGEDVAVGSELELNVAAGQSQLKGGDGRVRILIMPEGTADPAN